MIDMNTSEKTVLFASAASWIEGESLRQLERVAALPGMVRVAGFPDLHPGKGSPVGAAMLSKGEFYPYLVGSDVGCGMGLFSTELSVARSKPEKWAGKLKQLEEPWDGDSAAWLDEHGVHPDGFTAAVGTIGKGNHFAELLRVETIQDVDEFENMGMDEDRLFLLVHSGSRSLGENILRAHTDRFRDGSLVDGSEEAATYLARHDNALGWACANRELIALRFLEQLDSGYGKIADLFHNSITPIATSATSDGCRYLHRKGAAPSDAGAVIVPGSRGTCSYLVMPEGNQESNLWSLAHGAGRKWNRSECKGRLRERYSVESLRKTKLGSYVICEDKDLLYEEAPQAYKNIEAVIGDMLSFGLIRIIATFSPVLTYKVRER
jgi:release factor H-coupled RctB family protein